MTPEPFSHSPRLRLMVPADVDAVMAIEQAAYEFPWTEGILRDCLRVGYSCWVLEHWDRIEGYLILSVAAGEAHLLNLCVHPRCRRQGHGRRLLEHALDVATRLGADTLYLEVRVSNDAAIALYRGHGFNEIGIRHDYYPARNGREDALVMARVLDARGV